MKRSAWVLVSVGAFASAFALTVLLRDDSPFRTHSSDVPKAQLATTPQPQNTTLPALQARSAACELAVLTRASESKILSVTQVQTLVALGKGSSKEVFLVASALENSSSTSFESMTRERWVLPPHPSVMRDTEDFGSALKVRTELSGRELTQLYAMERAVVVRTSDAAQERASTAGRCWSIAAVLARELSGYVHDPLMDELLGPEQAELYVRTRGGFSSAAFRITQAPTSSAHVRLLTLGLRRYGSSDLVLYNLPENLSRAGAVLMNHIADSMVRGLGSAEPLRSLIRFRDAAIDEGFPENHVLEIVPVISWSEVFRTPL
jgi:hypothetical protein